MFPNQNISGFGKNTKYTILWFWVFFSGIGIYEKEKNAVFQGKQVFKNVSKNIPIPKMLSRKCFLN